MTLSPTGNLVIPIASKGAGKVLTSDANGNATWETPSGGGSSTNPEVFVVKTADESVNNLVVPQDDDHLTLSWGTNKGIYRIKAFIIAQRAAAGNSIKYTFAHLGFGSLSYSYFAVDGNWDMAPYFGFYQSFWGNSTTRAVTLTGIIDATGNDITGVKFQWAQTTSSGTSCKVLKGSYISYEKISN